MNSDCQSFGTFRYDRVDSARGQLSFVVVNFGEDPFDEEGMEFSSREPDEVRWHPFEPEDAERREVKRLLRLAGHDACPRIDVAKLRRNRQASEASMGLLSSAG